MRQFFGKILYTDSFPLVISEYYKMLHFIQVEVVANKKGYVIVNT